MTLLSVENKMFALVDPLQSLVRSFSSPEHPRWTNRVMTSDTLWGVRKLTFRSSHWACQCNSKACFESQHVLKIKCIQQLLTHLIEYIIFIGMKKFKKQGTYIYKIILIRNTNVMESVLLFNLENEQRDINVRFFSTWKINLIACWKLISCFYLLNV